MRCAVAILMLVLLAASAVADDAVDPAKVDALITQLGDDRYVKRVEAQRNLWALGPGALEHAVERFARTDDPEVRLRLRLYGREYFEQYVRPRIASLRRPAFLGVSQGVGIGPRGRPVITVQAVVPDSAAAEAGFLPGDQILEMDHRSLDADAAAFSRAVKDRKPGAPTRFTVHRGGEVVELTATLQPIPAKHMPEDLLDAQEARLAEHRAAWWAEHFAADPAPTPSR